MHKCYNAAILFALVLTSVWNINFPTYENN